MCHTATGHRVIAATVWLTVAGLLSAQTLEWRRVGNSAIEAGLPGLATGPVARVWFSPDGNSLFAQGNNGRVWQTADFQNWQPSGAVPPARAAVAADRLPEPSALVQRANATRYYALGRFVHRSENGGSDWSNVTAFRNNSILGDGLADIAISPSDPDQVVVAGYSGVWGTLDGGNTWTGLNEGLANLPATKLVSLPDGLQPMRASWTAADGSDLTIEWSPGERTSWRLSNASLDAEKQRLSVRLASAVTALARSGEYIYAGLGDGRIFASADRGQNWQLHNAPLESGAVTAIAAKGNLAVATVTQRNARYRAPRVIRTATGGRVWDDITSDLPVGGWTGVAVDWTSGTIYVAGEAGLFSTVTDLENLVPAGRWESLAGLPNSRPVDVMLDAAGNQIYVLLEGFGVYASLAPHRLRQLQIVNAADYSQRAAAPGGLLSILGARIDRVRAGDRSVPVLGSNDTETQIQVPFEMRGTGLQLTLEQAGRVQEVGVPLQEISPAVFVDRDGAPLLLDADSGSALDAKHAARSGSRVQILMTGLGAVIPEWPTATAAPVENPPRVAAPVKAFVDRQPVEVVRATLAPTYIGFYLVEIQLPKLINLGPAELYLEAGGKESNRVRLYLEP